MKAEKLISKGVKHHFSIKENQVLFDVISLEDHYDGLIIHKSDIIYLEEGELVNGYVKVGDVNMDDAVSKEFVEEVEASITLPVNPIEGVSYELQDSTSKTIYQGGMENPFEWKDGIVDSEAVLKIEVTAETLNDNPELVAEGIVVGETITVDAVEPIEEIIPAKVVKKRTSKK